MHHRMSGACILIFLIILNLLSSSVKGFSNGVNQMHSLHDKDGVLAGYMKRKVLLPDAVLDYDYAGANPKHDPRGRKPGYGKNP